VALTVKPDDEVYQFDSVWLGPDEYTLPIQARYVAWGTWLTCFLLATAVLVPLGGHGPGGVIGSMMWSLAISVVASRAVMLAVDHERPLRSLPQLFGAEARAAMAATRGRERSLLLRPASVRVREIPERVIARRAKERRWAEQRAAKKGIPAPARDDPLAAEERAQHVEPAEPVWGVGHFQSDWTPDAATTDDDWAEPPAAGWSLPTIGAVSSDGAHPHGESQHWDDPDGGEKPIEARILLPLRKAR
jgi:hypothetical protein